MASCTRHTQLQIDAASNPAEWLPKMQPMPHNKLHHAANTTQHRRHCGLSRIEEGGAAVIKGSLRPPAVIVWMHINCHTGETGSIDHVAVTLSPGMQA